LGVVTQEQAEASAKFNIAMADMSQIFSTLSRETLLSMLPAMTGFVEVLTDIGIWMRNNREFVTGFFVAAGGAITAIFLPAIISAATALFALLSPFLLLTAVILGIGVAFGLLVDDIAAFSKGNDSLLGRMLDKWPKVAQVFTDIGNAINFAIEALKSFDPGKSIQDAKDFFKFGSDGEDKRPRERIFPSPTDTDVANAMHIPELGKMLLDQAASFPLNSRTPQSISNSLTNNGAPTVTIQNINLETQATDAQGISKEIGSQLINQIKAAINSADDGVIA